MPVIVVDLLAAAVVQVVTVRWFAGIVLLGVIVLAITLETPGLMFRHLQHVLQAVMISGEVIVPFVDNGTNCIFLRDHLAITLEAGINIHHRSMLDIVADVGLQTMVITKKNGTTVYREQIYLGTDCMTGKQVYTTISAPTKKELKNKREFKINEFKENGYTRYKSVTVKNYRELSELWLENYKLEVRPQSYRNTVNLLNKYLLPAFGDMKVERITLPMVQTFVNRLVNSGLVSYKVVISINKRILKYAVNLQLISVNPADNVIVPKVKNARKEKIKYKKFTQKIRKIPLQQEFFTKIK